MAIAPNFGAAFGARALWLIGYRFAFVNLLPALAVVSPPAFKGMSMGIMEHHVVRLGCGLFLWRRTGRYFGWRGAMLGFNGTAVVGVIIFARFTGIAPMLRLPLASRAPGPFIPAGLRLD